MKYAGQLSLNVYIGPKKEKKEQTNKVKTNKLLAQHPNVCRLQQEQVPVSASVHNKAVVFNQGVVTPGGSVEVLQGVPQNSYNFSSK